MHGRVIFLGDSAHVVSPFGARGGNGGIQDADNLAWKLALVLRGEAPPDLLASYDEERVRAADENILNSARATRFMTPKSEIERVFRAAVLDLAADHAFARRLVNSGRLSLPCALDGLSLQTPAEAVSGLLTPGAVCPDAQLEADAFLLSRLGGGFSLLAVGDVAVPEGTGLPVLRIGADRDPHGFAAVRYGAALYLIRPDQHVAARLTGASAAGIRAALARAKGES